MKTPLTKHRGYSRRQVTPPHGDPQDYEFLEEHPRERTRAGGERVRVRVQKTPRRVGVMPYDDSEGKRARRKGAMGNTVKALKGDTKVLKERLGIDLRKSTKQPGQGD